MQTIGSSAASRRSVRPCRVAFVEFELTWAPHLLATTNYTYRERHGEAIYRFKDGMLPKKEAFVGERHWWA